MNETKKAKEEAMKGLLLFVYNLQTFNSFMAEAHTTLKSPKKDLRLSL